MSTMPDRLGRVIGGVDTHRDVHAVAAIDERGRVLGTASFEVGPDGYGRLVSWLESFGPVGAVGVEGTGSWGAGLSRFLTTVGIEVREVTRLSRQHRRRHGKSDTTDAVGAAKAVLAGDATAQPRGGTGPTEALRLIRNARSSAVKARTAITNQIHAVVATAPDQLRADLNRLSIPAVVAIAVDYQPDDPTGPLGAAQLALRSYATRWRHLSQEIDTLQGHIRQLVDRAAPPALLDETGVGPLVAADLLITAGANPDRLWSEGSFAALCGSSPVAASSGLQQRHRLNRGGDRQANAALYRAVIVRLRYHQPTRDYMTRRLAQGKTKPEIIRCLKRYLARRIHHILTNPPT
jgi:transposase